MEIDMEMNYRLLQITSGGQSDSVRIIRNYPTLEAGMEALWSIDMPEVRKPWVRFELVEVLGHVQ